MSHTHSNELAHSGVKGMKWGVRRYRNKDGSLTPAGKKRYYDNWSDDAKSHYELKKKTVKEMSNSELKKFNERVRLEQEYSRLNPTKIKKGMAIATATAATWGTMNTLYNTGSSAIKVGKNVADSILKK